MFDKIISFAKTELKRLIANVLGHLRNKQKTQCYACMKVTLNSIAEFLSAGPHQPLFFFFFVSLQSPKLPKITWNGHDDGNGQLGNQRQKSRTESI